MNNSVSLGGYSDVTVSGSLAVFGSLTQSGVAVPNNTSMITSITTAVNSIIANVVSLQTLSSGVYGMVA